MSDLSILRGGMEKKRPIGITVTGIIEILLGLYGLTGLLMSIFSPEKIGYLTITVDIPLAFLLWFGIALLRLKPFSRKASLWAAALCLVMSLLFITVLFFGLSSGDLLNKTIALLVSAAFPIAVFCPMIYYLTRPRIKELFR